MKEIVIKIDDAIYNGIVNMGEFLYFGTYEHLLKAIKNGTELPKGHGRLIDIDKAVENEETFRKYFSITTHPLMNGKIINCVAPSVVEADKEYGVEVVTRGNCMICGKELTEGLFFCKECESKGK